MSLPALRPCPGEPREPPPATILATPPPTSPCSPAPSGCSFRTPTPTPAQVHFEEILLAQEAAEDERLRARARQLWRESQGTSCPKDNETTQKLQHTKWPEMFRDRPLDIITASAR
ncbi:hypothetical protein PCL_07294 [Purpureocillium lilacinum]|uniref:Uncharacterized protein n=1 Tax=Purpureocillium lilacinum TaxID=33203 RepID=A0A2U3DSM7_PURLI|nr:hypothetical protein PCL_07294 [Purpureocillium lilacinum]